MNEHISSDRLIGYHRSRQDYTESPVNALQFAYGDQRYSKMTYELLNESDILKQKILNQAIQDFSLCQNVSQALLSSDILSVVLQHLKNKHDNIRLLSATLFKKICAAPQGRRTIIKRDCIQDFEKLIHDELAVVKSQVYEGLIDFAEFTEGIDCILSKQKILTDLEKIPEILLKAIILLKVLMQGEEGTEKALKTEIISRLMSLIGHTNEKIQYNVCMTLANMSFNESGKVAIVGKGCIKQICKYVTHHDKLVREASSLLLCSLAQLNQGKIQILAYCPFPNIQNLLSDESPTVLNAVQLIGNLAENPRGRVLATQIEGKLQKIHCIQRKYIDETLQVIRWKP